MCYSQCVANRWHYGLSLGQFCEWLKVCFGLLQHDSTLPFIFLFQFLPLLPSTECTFSLTLWNEQLSCVRHLFRSQSVSHRAYKHMLKCHPRLEPALLHNSTYKHLLTTLNKFPLKFPLCLCVCVGVCSCAVIEMEES